MKTSSSPSIRMAVSRAFVIAHREDTSRLEAELRDAGIEVTVLRQHPDELVCTYSPNLRCLLNHASGWEIAARSEGLSLFVEADFTPCRNFGDLPLPFDPSIHGETSWGYLYAGGPRIYDRLESGHLLAHACSTVAYVMPPNVARLALRYVAELHIRHVDWTRYHPFDTEIQWHLMGMGARAFVPRRQLGEHGGRSNPEHLSAGMGSSRLRRLLTRIDVGRNHHADALAGPLAFQPFYTDQGILKLMRTRIEGRAIGWARLLRGQTIVPSKSLPISRRLSLYWHGVLRLLF